MPILFCVLRNIPVAESSFQLGVLKLKVQMLDVHIRVREKNRTRENQEPRFCPYFLNFGNVSQKGLYKIYMSLMY